MSEPPYSGLARVRYVISRLLDPESGCPWDLKQTPESIGSYILEETYELLEAVESGDTAGVKEELGDCFFLFCFLTRLFQNQGVFDLEDVLTTAADKMIARHPHIFAGTRALRDTDEVRDQWQRIKRAENHGSILSGVPKNLPALLRTHRLTERAGRAGFDWNDPHEVRETLDNELAELDQAMETKDPVRISEEMGDVLFTMVNMARHLKCSAEQALRTANDRFYRRFQYIEDRLAEEGRTPEETPLAELDRLWSEAKDKGL